MDKIMNRKIINKLKLSIVILYKDIIKLLTLLLIIKLICSSLIKIPTNTATSSTYKTILNNTNNSACLPSSFISPSLTKGSSNSKGIILIMDSSIIQIIRWICNTTLIISIIWCNNIIHSSTIVYHLSIFSIKDITIFHHQSCIKTLTRWWICLKTMFHRCQVITETMALVIQI